jgi:hypothetical protein
MSDGLCAERGRAIILRRCEIAPANANCNGRPITVLIINYISVSVTKLFFSVHIYFPVTLPLANNTGSVLSATPRVSTMQHRRQEAFSTDSKT